MTSFKVEVYNKKNNIAKNVVTWKKKDNPIVKPNLLPKYGIRAKRNTDPDDSNIRSVGCDADHVIVLPVFGR